MPIVWKNMNNSWIFLPTMLSNNTVFIIIIIIIIIIYYYVSNMDIATELKYHDTVSYRTRFRDNTRACQ